MWVRPLGQEDPLEKEILWKKNTPVFLSMENSMDRGAWWATVHRSQRVVHRCPALQVDSLSLSHQGSPRFLIKGRRIACRQEWVGLHSTTRSFFFFICKLGDKSSVESEEGVYASWVQNLLWTFKWHLTFEITIAVSKKENWIKKQ